MTEIEGDYGLTYHPIEELNIGARNDFTLQELKHAFEINYDEDEDEDGYPTYYGKKIDFLYPKREDVDEQGYSLTETRDNGEPKYVGYRDRSKPPIGFRLSNPGEFDYEGGTLLGFGKFNLVISGNLGDGHEAWNLFEHVESGRLFLNTGWYSSWDSGEMDEWTEVEPVEQTVLRYKSLDSDEVFDNPVVDVK